MTRPSRTGGKTGEGKAGNISRAKGRKITKTKRRIAPAAARVKRPSVSSPSKDLKEARAQQAATAEILKVIASSPSDVQPVLDAIAETSARLCGADFAFVYKLDADTFHLAASNNANADWVRYVRDHPVGPGRATVVGRTLLERRTVHVKDVLADREYTDVQRQRLGKYRTTLGVPLLHDRTPIGSIILLRTVVKPFSPTQISLVETFANQAVIAIENTRLFNETQEALERQTATADILKVIASSPSDTAPVFEAIAGSSKRLIGAFSAAVFRFLDGTVHLAALTSVHPIADEAGRADFPRPLDDFPPFRQAQGGEPFAVPDTELTPHEGIRQVARVHGFRSILYVPLMNGGVPTGVISVTRSEPGALAPHHVQLLQAFADQAVIAIENTRLFNETQEALERQTATADILKVIASSPDDVQPVFEAIVSSAAKLFEPCGATITTLKDGELHWAATAASVSGFDDGRVQSIYPIPFDPDRVPSARAILDRRIVEIPDVAAPGTPEYTGKAAAASGFRSITYVPLIDRDHGIGTIILSCLQTGFRFSDRQLALVQSFADQAVIAIQNARLFNETKEALERQTATADILKVIASSPDDVHPVFEAIVANAARLVGGFSAGVYRFIDGLVHLEANSVGPDGDETLRVHFPRPIVDDHFRMAQAGEVVEIADTEDQPNARLKEVGRTRGFRSLLFVPLKSGGASIGVIAVSRQTTGAFAPHHVDLLQTFADQAVIAIENARQFNKTQEALERQTATADILKVIASSPTDVQPVFDAIAERSKRLLDAHATSVFRFARDTVELVSFTPVNPEADATLRAAYPRPIVDVPLFANVRDGETVQITDSQSEEYVAIEPSLRGIARARGFRSLIVTPLVADGAPVGVISVTRKAPGSFAAHHVELLQTFADQAVIAISNVELFEQVQQRSRELSQSLDDLRTAQDRLVQTEKLASLGQLTAGIAHEIKNPLNFVNNFSALSAELIDEMTEVFENPKLDEASRRKELDEIRELLKSNLEKVVQHGKRADSIVKNMLLHSREGLGEHRPVDINAIVEDSLNLAYHGARAEKSGFTITLRQNLDAGAGAVELYPQEITRALLNLISNGFYAATRRKVETGDESFEPVLSVSTRNLGTTVEIRIRDNGTGIPSEVREKMYNPFFTTKPPGEGTGLGLSMTHDIVVKQHGGTIDMATEPEQFTEFIIVLPRKSNVSDTDRGRT